MSSRKQEKKNTEQAKPQVNFAGAQTSLRHVLAVELSLALVGLPNTTCAFLGILLSQPRKNPGCPSRSWSNPKLWTTHPIYTL